MLCVGIGNIHSGGEKNSTDCFRTDSQKNYKTKHAGNGSPAGSFRKELEKVFGLHAELWENHAVSFTVELESDRNVPISFTSQLKISGSRHSGSFSGKKYKMTSVLLHQLRNQPIL